MPENLNSEREDFFSQLEIELIVSGVPDAKASLQEIIKANKKILNDIPRLKKEMGGTGRALKVLANKHKQRAREGEKANEKLKKGFRSLTSEVKKYGSEITNAAKKLIIPTSLGGAVSGTIEYKKSLLAVSASVNRLGIGLGSLQTSLEGMSKRTTLLRKETVQLFNQYQESMRFISLQQFENILNRIKDIVGANVQEISKMQGSLAAISQEYPDLAMGLAKMEKGENAVLRARIRSLYFIGKITDAQYKQITAYISGNTQLTAVDRARQERMQSQIDATNTFRRQWEAVTLALGEGLLPYVEQLADHLKTIQEMTKNWEFSLLKIAGIYAGLKIAGGLAIGGLGRMATGAITGGVGASLAYKAGMGTRTLGPAALAAYGYYRTYKMVQTGKEGRSAADKFGYGGDLDKSWWKGSDAVGAGSRVKDVERMMSGSGFKKSGHSQSRKEREFLREKGFEDFESYYKWKRGQKKQEKEKKTQTKDTMRSMRAGGLIEEFEKVSDKIMASESGSKEYDKQKMALEVIIPLLGKQRDVVERITGLFKTQTGYTDALIKNMAITGDIDPPKMFKAMKESLKTLDATKVARENLIKILKIEDPIAKKKALEEQANNKESSEASRSIYKSLSQLNLEGLAQLDTKKLILEQDMAILDITKQQSQEYAKAGNEYKHLLSLTQAQATGAGLLVQLADNYAIGVGASMKMRMQEFDAIGKNINILRKELGSRQEAYDIAVKMGAPGEKRLDLETRVQEKNNEIVQQQIKQASLVKSMRDQWISVISAMNTGMGSFSKIMMNAEQNTAQIQRLGGAVRSAASGAYAQRDPFGYITERVGFQGTERMNQFGGIVGRGGRKLSDVSYETGREFGQGSTRAIESALRGNISRVAGGMVRRTSRVASGGMEALGATGHRYTFSTQTGQDSFRRGITGRRTDGVGVNVVLKDININIASIKGINDLSIKVSEGMKKKIEEVVAGTLSDY